MNNDYQIKKPLDMTKINSNDMGELLWWSYWLGTYPEKLLSITHEVGNSTEEVTKHLKFKVNGGTAPAIPTV
jgi:hypothetical protein